MRGHIRRRSMKNIPKPPTSSAPVKARDEDIPDKTDTILNYQEFVEKTAIGKMKNTVEQMLQDHLEKFTKLILMEECTSKQCYVRLRKLSHTNYHDNSSKEKKAVHLFKSKKKRPEKTKANKLLPKSSKENNDGNNHVTSLTLTIPRIRRKTHCLIANCPKKDCLIHFNKISIYEHLTIPLQTDHWEDECWVLSTPGQLCSVCSVPGHAAIVHSTQDYALRKVSTTIPYN